MEEYVKPKVRYIGCSIEQVRWGSNDDPNKLLTVGKIYTLKTMSRHTWHTKYELEEFPDKWFNSVCFEDVA